MPAEGYTKEPSGSGGPGGGAVDSVFGRTGTVIAVSGDYSSTLVTNLSTVAGATVTDALNALDGHVPALHAAQHENAGADEISVIGLSGLLADAQTPLAHAIGGAAHTVSTLAALNLLVSDANMDDSGAARTPTAHAAAHQNGGGDEISVAGLSGALADPQDADALIATGPVTLTIGAIADGEVLVRSGTTIISQAAGAGEANTASNVGSGIGVFHAKVVADLQLRSINGTQSITTTLNTDTVEVAVTALSIDTGQLTDAGVTFPKLLDATAISVLIGRGAAAGVGDFEEITLGAGLTMTGTVLSSSGGGAPVGAEYVVAVADATLTDERVFTDGAGINSTLAAGTITVENTLVTGIAGNQTITAGTAAGNDLLLRSTSDPTLGFIDLDGDLRIEAAGLSWRDAVGVAANFDVDFRWDQAANTSVGSCNVNASGSATIGALTSNGVDLFSYGGTAAGSSFGTVNANTLKLEAGGVFKIGTTGTNDLIFGVNDTEVARIDETDDVFIIGTATLGVGGTNSMLAINTITGAPTGNAGALDNGSARRLIGDRTNTALYMHDTTTTWGKIGPVFANEIDNTLLANMAARTVKLNATNGSADPTDFAMGAIGNVLISNGTTLIAAPIQEVVWADKTIEAEAMANPNNSDWGSWTPVPATLGNDSNNAGVTRRAFGDSSETGVGLGKFRLPATTDHFNIRFLSRSEGEVTGDVFITLHYRRLDGGTGPATWVQLDLTTLAMQADGEWLIDTQSLDYADDFVTDLVAGGYYQFGLTRRIEASDLVGNWNLSLVVLEASV